MISDSPIESSLLFFEPNDERIDDSIRWTILRRGEAGDSADIGLAVADGVVDWWSSSLHILPVLQSVS